MGSSRPSRGRYRCRLRLGTAQNQLISSGRLARNTSYLFLAGNIPVDSGKRSLIFLKAISTRHAVDQTLISYLEWCAPSWVDVIGKTALLFPPVACSALRESRPLISVPFQ